MEVESALNRRYVLDQELGRSGASTTWLAHPRKSAGFRLIVKELQLELLPSADAARADAEAEQLSQFHHPNLPDVVELLRETDKAGLSRLYLIREYIEGKDLAQELASGRRFSEAEVVRIARGVASALAYLHGSSPPFLHLALEPGNLLQRAGDGQVYLIDFGAFRTPLPGSKSGTAPRAPELLTGQARPESDLYALGMTLLHLLSGQNPAQLQRKQQPERPQLEISARFARVLARLIAADPARRYPNARALIADLVPLERPAVKPQVTARPEPPMPQVSVQAESQPIAPEPVMPEIPATGPGLDEIPEESPASPPVSEEQLQTAPEAESAATEIQAEAFESPESVGAESAVSAIEDQVPIEQAPVESEASEPVFAEPEAVEPEAVEPETVEPRLTEPESLEPESLESESLEPRKHEPDSAEQIVDAPDFFATPDPELVASEPLPTEPQAEAFPASKAQAELTAAESTPEEPVPGESELSETEAPSPGPAAAEVAEPEFQTSAISPAPEPEVLAAESVPQTLSQSDETVQSVQAPDAGIAPAEPGPTWTSELPAQEADPEVQESESEPESRPAPEAPPIPAEATKGPAPHSKPEPSETLPAGGLESKSLLSRHGGKLALAACLLILTLGGLALRGSWQRTKLPPLDAQSRNPFDEKEALSPAELSDPAGLTPQDARRQGDARYASHDFAAAAKLYARALSDPGLAREAELWYRRGFSYGQNGQHALAIADFEKALKLEPGIRPDWAQYNLGWNYYHARRYDLALKAFKAQLAHKPDHLEAINYLGLVQTERKQYGEALKAFDQALTLKPDYAYAINNRGRLHYAQADVEKALLDYDRAIAADSTLPLPHYNKAELYYDQGRYLLCLDATDKALAISKGYASAQNMRGLCHHGLGEIDKAIADFRQAVGQEPAYAGAWFNLGLAYNDLGRLELAREAYSKALASQPDHDKTLNNLGLLSERERKPKEALGYYDRAIAVKAEGLYYSNRGNLLRQLGNCPQARVDWHRACELGYQEACFSHCSPSASPMASPQSRSQVGRAGSSPRRRGR